MIENYDLIVIGGGRASGLAIAAAKSGLKTALVERDKLGGACPNRGCVPSKLLIGFAEAANRVREAERHFIDTQLKSIDAARIFESVNNYVGGVDERYEGRIIDSGVELIRGEASFIGSKRLSVGERTLTARRIVIATGSRPLDAPYAELPIWTSDSLFPMADTPPKSLLVIGGGFIGCEMAAFFAGIGVETHLFARSGRLLANEDGEIETVFQTEFSKQVNTNTHCHANLTGLTYNGAEFTATFEIHGKTETFTADRVLFAIGRRPNTEALKLENTGLAANERGFLAVDSYLQTSVDGIYAAGDVNGRYMLQHAAHMSFATCATS